METTLPTAFNIAASDAHAAAAAPHSHTNGVNVCSSGSSSITDDITDAQLSSVATPLIDKSLGVVSRVGALGPLYWKWVADPEYGQPRFFTNPLLEACSKTPWWVVPLVWLPLFVWCSHLAVARHGLPVHLTVSLALVGIVAWQLLEYYIHRFVFHAHTSSPIGITLHFLFHGCHHKYPMDHLRLVFPPVPASVLVGSVYVMLHALVPKGTAVALFAGMGYGYVLYDCLHYAIHHNVGQSSHGLSAIMLPGLLFELRSRHFDHHFRDESHGFGISSVFFDVLFGTSAKLEVERKGRR